MVDPAAFAASSFPALCSPAIITLSLNYLRNLKKCPVRVRSILQGDILRQRFPETVSHILADGVCEAGASLLRRVPTAAVQDLGHGHNFVSLQLVESVDVFQNGIQILQHVSALRS